jgi:membrane-associated HD superfamily phosphohydrolase
MPTVAPEAHRPAAIIPSAMSRSRVTMVRDRTRRAILAGISTVLWLGYMVVGLAVIDAVAPTVGGEGPEGAAAFVGLVWGVVTVGLIMWAASD